MTIASGFWAKVLRSLLRAISISLALMGENKSIKYLQNELWSVIITHNCRRNSKEQEILTGLLPHYYLNQLLICIEPLQAHAFGKKNLNWNQSVSIQWNFNRFNIISAEEKSLSFCSSQWQKWAKWYTVSAILQSTILQFYSTIYHFISNISNKIWFI